MIRGLFIVLILGISFSPPISAHGVEEKVEQAVDKYLVQISFDALEAQSGDPVPISFSLSDKEKEKPIDFSAAWVRVSKDEKIVFSGLLGKPELGPTRISVAMNDPGEYEVNVNFYKDVKSEDKTSLLGEESINRESIVEATMPLTIQESEIQNQDEAKQSLPNIIYLSLATVIGIMVGFSLTNLIKKNK